MGYPILELERRADPDGEWISYGVRMMLDLAGLKISLEDWQKLPRSKRDELTATRAETDGELRAFVEKLERALVDSGVAARPLSQAKQAEVAFWRVATEPNPDAVAVLNELNADPIWPQLDRFARYLVCSFSRKRDIERARSALEELGYLPTGSAVVRIDGIVLAGGLSTRFGRDKRTVEFAGEELVASACRRMSAAVDGRVVTVTGEREEHLPGTEVGIVCADDEPGRGPLGGLATGLARTRFGAVVMAVDTPMVSVETLARLAAIGRAKGHPAALKTGSRWEPLVAFYPRSVLNDVRAALSEGRSAPHRLLDDWRTIAVEPTHGDEVSNINTPTDLGRTLERAAGRSDKRATKKETL